jgi:hypothetical protein
MSIEQLHVPKSAAKRHRRSKHHPKNPRNISRLGAMALIDPLGWAEEIRRAMERAGGHVPDAAAYLDISGQRLYVILRDPRFASVERAKMGRPSSKGKAT